MPRRYTLWRRMNYVTTSGDLNLQSPIWHTSQAYEFLPIHIQCNGFPKNLRRRTRMIEGGPLLPIESEFYQSRGSRGNPGAGPLSACSLGETRKQNR